MYSTDNGFLGHHSLEFYGFYRKSSEIYRVAESPVSAPHQLKSGSTTDTLLLPPTNEVWGKVMFYTCLSFCSQGGGRKGCYDATSWYGQYPHLPVNKRAVLIILECFLVTAHKRSLEQGNVVTRICHSVHGGVSVRKTPRTETPYGKERSVGILLEYILVCTFYHYDHEAP